MPLSADDLKVVRARVGDAVEQDVLDERYDRLGSVDAVIRETLSHRLANLLAEPASFSVPGEYSQSNEGTIKALGEDLAGALGLPGSGTFAIRNPADPDPR